MIMVNVGDKAPAFDLMSDEGRQVRLRDFAGKNLILYFYPKDDTPGCTKEACAFRDDAAAFSKKNAMVIGISLDPVKSHQSFKKKFNLPFPLLSDEGAVVSKAYGVYKKKSMYGRTYWGIERSTFVIGPDGKIKAIFPKVKVDGHNDELLALFN
jgi:thioredoxin-dependent peroxiredoxin